MKRPAVFLDRDGTIVDDAGYASRFDQMAIFPQSFEAVRRLNEAGLTVVVVTNQSGIGRGYLTEDELADIHSAGRIRRRRRPSRRFLFLPPFRRLPGSPVRPRLPLPQTPSRPWAPSRGRSILGPGPFLHGRR